MAITVSCLSEQLTCLVIDSVTFNEFDGDGVYAYAAFTNFEIKNSRFTNNFDGIEFYNNFPRNNVDITSCYFDGS